LLENDFARMLTNFARFCSFPKWVF